MSELRKYLSKDGTIRLATAITTGLANEAFQYLEASPLVKVMMSRALTGAALMASQMKEGLSLSLNFIGDGPIKNLFAAANYEGEVRAYCENRGAELPEGSSDLGEGLGSGHLDVTTQQPFEREPHRGTVQLLTGEIAEDIAYYIQQSHQIPCIVALSAIPSESGVEIAGGFILELMPGYTEETITRLEKLHAMIGSLSGQIKQGAKAEDLVRPYLDHFAFEEITHPYQLAYRCGCSVDRVERSLLLLGPATLDDMIASGETSDVQCEFCGKQYSLGTDDLERLRKTLPAQLH